MPLLIWWLVGMYIAVAMGVGLERDAVEVDQDPLEKNAEIAT